MQKSNRKQKTKPEKNKPYGEGEKIKEQTDIKPISKGKKEGAWQ